MHGPRAILYIGGHRAVSRPRADLITTDGPAMAVAQPRIDMAEHPSHRDLQEALGRADADAGAAEAHGMLCGMLCAEQGVDRAAWLRDVLGEHQEPGDLARTEAIGVLDELLDRTLKQMGDGMLRLRLLLPDDEQSLSTRVSALGTWCEGFLLGISRAQPGGKDALSEEVRELLTDLVEITKVDAREVDEDQDDERSYAEVVEYVRMGVLLAFEQARGPEPPAPSH